ncbi:GntR family transcriptional regulator [Roseibium polysiphoniae]|uniref:GntR family transcriptional regulator n=1 Tax=Roseibium polysiphoniae TaxID=2571221 RepID=A0A944CAU3_9HYPH|nr:GntR family transcriptional regulator [Roseibium polysiphoniae]MBS8258871.1 GntR family transcriptional regulator [Roseibium polysiphoniae]
MTQENQAGGRRTSVDEIFDDLYDDITSMRLRPGDRISEADIAAKFGVSRQPVRDAFSRLENLNLLLIRPQRATEVRRFSAREIEKSRFVRAAVEAEVFRRAARLCDDGGEALLEKCLADQRKVIAEQDYEAFGALDYAFHKLLCEIAKVDFAFDVIRSEKAKVDRLCMLGLAKEDRMPQLLDDHGAIVAAVTGGDEEKAVEAGMIHLSRLDATIERISAINANYFETETE